MCHGTVRDGGSTIVARSGRRPPSECVLRSCRRPVQLGGSEHHGHLGGIQPRLGHAVHNGLSESGRVLCGRLLPDWGYLQVLPTTQREPSPMHSRKRMRTLDTQGKWLNIFSHQELSFTYVRISRHHARHDVVIVRQIITYFPVSRRQTRHNTDVLSALYC
jgi:hypothetical protein